MLAAASNIEVIAETGDGTEAVRLAISERPDVVVMDISLPQMSGVEATQRIMAADSTIKILILTAHEDVACARTVLDAGALGYALKLRAGEELVRAVRIVAGGGIYIDPSVAGALVRNGGTTRHSGAKVTTLSERESEVIRLISRGQTSKEMAQRMGLSPRTLETYRARAMSKLNMRTRGDLIRYAMQRGWLRDL